MKKIYFGVALALVASVGFVACKKKPSANLESVGVAECDEFIKKYAECVESKVPDAQRGALNDGLKKMVEGWKEAAKTPAGKEGLATGCKMAMDQTKASLSAFGCNM